MTQRTVSIQIRLEAKEYFSGLRQMETATRKSQKTAEQAFGQQKKDLDALGKGALVVAGGFTAAFIAMVKAGADFEAKLSQISALGGEYEKNIGRLSDVAFVAGKAFGLSASQVADAEIELAKAGVSAKDILGGALPGALALASAGQIDVAKATSIASTAMVQFGKSGGQVPHIADLLAASANKSVGSVESVGDALNQSGLVAAQFGLSIEDTVGTLTSFSKAGLNGSDAGTSFKTMLLSLASPSKQAQAALDKYNITAYDSQGAFVGVTSLAEQLKTKFKGVSDANRDAALSTIFGTDAIRAANVLYKQGADVAQGFGDAQSVAGAATLAASKKLDNLNGDLQKIKASFQNNLINSAYSSNDALRSMVQGAGGAVAAFSKLPKELQGSAAGVVAVGAVVTATGAAFLLLTPKVIAARAAFLSFGVSGRSLVGLVGRGAGLALGITAVAAAFSDVSSKAEFTSQQLALSASSAKKNFQNIDSLFNQGDSLYSGVTDAASALKASFSGNAWDNVGQATRRIDAVTFGVTNFSKTFKTNEGQFAALGEQLAALSSQDYRGAANSFQKLVDKLGGGAEGIRQASLAFPAYREQIIEMLKATGQAATEQNILAGEIGKGGVASKIAEAQAAATRNSQALQTMAGSAADAKVDIDALSDTIAGFGSVALDSRSASRAFEAAVDDAAAAAKKNGATLDTSTEAGRANQEALDGIATAATRSAGAILKTSGSAEDAAAALRKGRKAFVDTAVDMGLGRAAAKRLADQLGLIPANVKTAVDVSGIDPAVGGVKSLIDVLRGLRDKHIKVSYESIGTDATKGVAGATIRRASGGSVDGPGPKGQDSVLAYLAPGEHVLTSKDVDRMGGQAAVYAFRDGLNGTPRFAAGGALTKRSVLEQSRAEFASALAVRKAVPKNAIAEVVAAANAADRSSDDLTKQIIAAKKREVARTKAVTAAEKAQERAQKAYENIDGTKKNRAEKKAAKAAVDAAKDDLDTAKKQADAAGKRVEDLRDDRSKAQDKRDDALTKAKKLREDREDFVSAQRRGVTDPLSYVDQLRSMSRDDNYAAARQKTFAAAANKYEAALVTLAKQSEAAAEKLTDLQGAAGSMRSGIASAITGGFAASSSKLADIVTDDWTEFLQTGTKYLAGVQVETYDQVDHKGGTTAGGYSADALDAYYASGSNSTGAFANDLQQLANRGVDGRLLAEIAGYGVEQGAPIAKALLSGTQGQIDSINRNYSNIQTNGSYAGGIVADYNFKALIDDAQANADKIAGQIASDGEKLRKLIASAFGLTGYAVGTMNATRGWHLVGEKGPELLNFAGGEQVATAARTRALMTAARPATGVTTVVKMPDTITVQDASGFTATMKVVAQSEIARDAMQDAVLRWGKGTM